MLGWGRLSGKQESTDRVAADAANYGPAGARRISERRGPADRRSEPVRFAPQHASDVVELRPRVCRESYELLNLPKQVGAALVARVNPPLPLDSTCAPDSGSRYVSVGSKLLRTTRTPQGIMPCHGSIVAQSPSGYNAPRHTCARKRYIRLTVEVRSWSGRPDSNRQPPAPHTGALPNCATPRPEAPLARVL